MTRGLSVVILLGALILLPRLASRRLGPTSVGMREVILALAIVVPFVALLTIDRGISWLLWSSAVVLPVGVAAIIRATHMNRRD